MRSPERGAKRCAAVKRNSLRLFPEKHWVPNSFLTCGFHLESLWCGSQSFLSFSLRLARPKIHTCQRAINKYGAIVSTGVSPTSSLLAAAVVRLERPEGGARRGDVLLENLGLGADLSLAAHRPARVLPLGLDRQAAVLCAHLFVIGLRHQVTRRAWIVLDLGRYQSILELLRVLFEQVAVVPIRVAAHS